MIDKSLITKNIALREWHIWNKILFSGELLTVPHFIILKDIDLGNTEGDFQEDDEDEDSCIIRISSDFARIDYIRFSIILIHEMIHQLQWERKLDVEHDEFFDKWCNLIRYKTGLDVK